MTKFSPLQLLARMPAMSFEHIAQAKAGCAISAQLSNFEITEIARAHGHAPSDPGSKM
jgi:hypothetical protein